MLDVDHGTYPFVTSSQRHRAARPPGPGSPPTASTASSPSSRRTRPRVGAGPFPPSSFDESARVPALRRLRVRHHHRPPAPHRLVRRPHRALRGAHQRRHRLRAHQARRAHRPRSASRCASPTTSTACALDEVPGQPDRLPPREADLRRAARVERGHHRRPHLRATCRRTPRTTCCALEADVRIAHRRRSASAPAARRSSCGTTCSTEFLAPR